MKVKVGHKYRFICGKIDEVVTIIKNPTTPNVNHTVYEARNEEGVYRICFWDDLFEI